MPPTDEQRAWERKRVEVLGGGKAYYSIAPGYKEFFEFLRHIAGEPALGTSGRVLPPFDNKWLEVWVDMPLIKIKRFEDEARKAEEEERKEPRIIAKL